MKMFPRRQSWLSQDQPLDIAAGWRNRRCIITTLTIITDAYHFEKNFTPLRTGVKVSLLCGVHVLLAIPSDRNSSQTPSPAYLALYIVFYSCLAHRSVSHLPLGAQSPVMSDQLEGKLWDPVSNLPSNSLLACGHSRSLQQGLSHVQCAMTGRSELELRHIYSRARQRSDLRGPPHNLHIIINEHILMNERTSDYHPHQ
jgi:hypothetical protein